MNPQLRLHAVPPLDILYIGTLPPHPGGSAISGSQLLIRFAELGHQIRAIAPMTDALARVTDEFASQQPEIEVIRYPVPHFLTGAYGRPSDRTFQSEQRHVQRLVRQSLGKRRPDVLFVGRESYAGQVIGVPEVSGIPSVLRVAGGLICEMMAESVDDDGMNEFLNQFHRFDQLITPAEYMARQLKEHGMPHTESILNAVDLNNFRPAAPSEALRRELGIGGGDVVVEFVGNFNSRKRPLDVVEAAQRALPMNSHLLFLFVGDGDQRQQAEESCREAAIADRCRFVGWVDYTRIPEYLNLADIAVMPSSSEGLARLYLETQACGRLLIASDIDAAKEVVEHGRTGLLFRVGDIDDLAQKILLAASDPQLRKDAAANGLRRVQQHSLDTAVSRYIAKFRNMIARHNRS